MDGESFFEITRRHSREIVPGYIVGDFGVHANPKEDPRGRQWRISHLPSGFLAAWLFPTKEAAIRAAGAMQRVRNDWAVISKGSVTRDLKREIEAVVTELGGELPEPSSAAHARESLERYSTSRNGYDAIGAN